VDQNAEKERQKMPAETPIKAPEEFPTSNERAAERMCHVLMRLA